MPRTKLTKHPVVLYVPSIKTIQQTLSFVAIGLSFAIGRTFNHFFQGVVFVFFDHPHDIGDRVELYNMAGSLSVGAVVKRQSLLYTVYRRLDNGADMQFSNERLINMRIENISRSGNNRQGKWFISN
jgi:small-conductance mechanosensitive channel